MAKRNKNKAVPGDIVLDQDLEKRAVVLYYEKIGVPVLAFPGHDDLVVSLDSAIKVIGNINALPTISGPN